VELPAEPPACRQRRHGDPALRRPVWHFPTRMAIGRDAGGTWPLVSVGPCRTLSPGALKGLTLHHGPGGAPASATPTGAGRRAARAGDVDAGRRIAVSATASGSPAFQPRSTVRVVRRRNGAF